MQIPPPGPQLVIEIKTPAAEVDERPVPKPQEPLKITSQTQETSVKKTPMNPWLEELIVGGSDILFRTAGRAFEDLWQAAQENSILKGLLRAPVELVRKSSGVGIRALLNGTKPKLDNFKLSTMATAEQAVSVMLADHAQVAGIFPRIMTRIANGLSRIGLRLGAYNAGIIKPTEFGDRDLKEMPTEVGIRALSSLLRFDNPHISRIAEQSLINLTEGVERVVNNKRYSAPNSHN